MRVEALSLQEIQFTYTEYSQALYQSLLRIGFVSFMIKRDIIVLMVISVYLLFTIFFNRIQRSGIFKASKQSIMAMPAHNHLNAYKIIIKLRKMCVDLLLYSFPFAFLIALSANR